MLRKIVQVEEQEEEEEEKEFLLYLSFILALCWLRRGFVSEFEIDGDSKLEKHILMFPISSYFSTILYCAHEHGRTILFASLPAGNEGKKCAKVRKGKFW